MNYPIPGDIHDELTFVLQNNYAILMSANPNSPLADWIRQELLVREVPVPTDCHLVVQFFLGSLPRTVEVQK